MSTEAEFAVNNIKDQITRLSCILEPYISGTAPSPVKLTLAAAALDRSTADQAIMIPLINELNPGIGIDTFASMYSVQQEDQRTRRDEVINRQRHKRLMYGCLETAYRHRLYLKDRIKDK